MSQTAIGPAPAPAPDPAGRSRDRRARLRGTLAGIVLAVVAALAVVVLRQPGGPAEPAAAVPIAWARPVVGADGLVQRTGVRITRVAVTGGGGLLDLRFQVVDADKAHGLHDPATPPALVDEHTGLVLSHLLMNHSHSGDYQPAVTYYLVFENTGGWVRRGGKVTVLLGNAQVEHVVVA